MATITQFSKFIELSKKYKVNLPEKVGYALRPLIDDIIFDVQVAGKVVTERIFSAVKDAIQEKSDDKVKAIILDFELWLKSNKKNLNESVYLEIEQYELPDDEDDLEDLGEIDLDEEEIEDDGFEIQDDDSRIAEANTMARAPKLQGKALKRRKAKANIMSKLNQNPLYMQAKEKLMLIAAREAKRIAREEGVKPSLVDVSKVIVRK